MFSIIGIICGISALVKISKDSSLKGKGLAISAILIGVIVILLQILVVVTIYNFFKPLSDVAKNFPENTPEQNLEQCLLQKNGISKDMCIFFVVIAYKNQTEQLERLDKNLCDMHMTIANLRNVCNAVLRKDASYCENIENRKSKINCYGVVEEYEKRNKE